LTPGRIVFALAVASGVLLALSFPTFGHPACAWVALAPLMVALQRGSLRRGFLLGVLTGGIYFGGTLYWITQVMVVYGGLAQSIAVPVNILLIAYLALFPGLFAVIVRAMMVAYGPRALMAAPLVWVATELGRTYLFSGFPWVLLGYSQTTVLPVAQLASVFGVYGLGALVASVSAASASAAVGVHGPAQAGHYRYQGYRYYGSGFDRFGRYIPILTVFVLVLGVAAWGSRRIARAEWTRGGEPIKVGLIQGNVDQAEKWDDARATSIFSSYISMTRQAIAEGAQLVIWPESSTPFPFEEQRFQQSAEVVRTLARQAQVPILLGSEEIEHGTSTRYFNSAFLVKADGATGGAYRKMHLVPFGEYVPLKRVFFFASRLVQAVSDFSAGTTPSLLPVGSHLVSTAICYEIVYPNLVRQFVRQGSELLTTITNDAWFGRTSAPYQHFEQASMRAIEEGRYLVRAANTGISGIVDPYGRVLSRSGIYEPAAIVGEARLLRGSTIYARVGDLFAYLSTVITLVLLLQSRIWRLSTT